MRKDLLLYVFVSLINLSTTISSYEFQMKVGEDQCKTDSDCIGKNNEVCALVFEDKNYVSETYECLDKSKCQWGEGGQGDSHGEDSG